jgi:aminoglycoside N3'-acetyltransferase
VDEWLHEAKLQSEGQVGNAHARLVRSRSVVSVVKGRLESEPLLFLHDPDRGCEECDEARLSVPRHR